MTTKFLRKLAALSGAVGLAFGLAAPAAQAAGNDYPNHTVELIVPYQPGGGTDALARAFADASRKHMSESIVIVNRPGAGGAIGWNEVIHSRPDGYKLAVLTVELLTLPHLGLAKFNYDDFQPIAQLNADPAAVTVKADSPYNTIEEFLAAAKKKPGEMGVGNSGTGSIWHLAASALEDKTGAKFNHIPFQGAGPAVLALLGGHVDAVAVSPAEVSTYVQAGKLKMLMVMADKRLAAFDKVPTAKERGIDISIGTWRGLGAPKNTPPEVMAKLRDIAAKTAKEPLLREVMDKQNLGYVYTDGAAFKETLAKDNAYFKALITKLDIKP
ncbi:MULTISPECIES: tripartite tricarboxylate transporter substrate binding protein [Variovorax]|jgi:tripartite-type tricarboxylate transporter receptor subunit TctC|uniref:tripartite tricarboxylate transporter substrate binding protein n=1 Tax=Variovorax TaxID=34072 RepID=UPI000869FBDC|nr:MULTISPECIES: tripartite tricarboxylate transporter substrate binding protein [Variovorax]MBN8753554.1 tripartite tricarboxylate transporter substrate binding protein [Variovorax sp.]ODU12959.1 MAG: ABC transporter substrate-binding protein [Variovorax sp. SCN 67-85]ODV27493.1 MAG: ABC transporter substrate-binding protein [Variovorax sp. SCN 67-20]OJZ12185.1 MAG: ABC transporter substrate-binding protein [Variovorax sp. 67-131]UKI05978.1 tripartite tricarboxylate transporter substrate bind